METFVLICFFAAIAIWLFALKHALLSDDPSFASLCSLLLLFFIVGKLKFLLRVFTDFEFIAFIFLSSIVVASCLSDAVKHEIHLPPLPGYGKSVLRIKEIRDMIKNPKYKAVAAIIRDAVAENNLNKKEE